MVISLFIILCYPLFTRFNILKHFKSIQEMNPTQTELKLKSRLQVKLHLQITTLFGLRSFDEEPRLADSLKTPTHETY